ncbi:hypothetical protein RvY_03253 [Ramazzottius varieornatus]|uniref:Uncharacterized protein n=1 Tax=Ramazzottius varieornatus TaxID=947166 RepID=A0A1D1UXL6_RAMVA|nr:hypothetical protein RvY_03253 [Ramazzottius varieornatus]
MRTFHFEGMTCRQVSIGRLTILASRSQLSSGILSINEKRKYPAQPLLLDCIPNYCQPFNRLLFAREVSRFPRVADDFVFGRPLPLLVVLIHGSPSGSSRKEDGRTPNKQQLEDWNLQANADSSTTEELSWMFERMDGCLVDQRFVWRGIPRIYFVLLTDVFLPFVDSRPLLVGSPSCFLDSS